jgi:hypothetical protein
MCIIRMHLFVLCRLRSPHNTLLHTGIIPQKGNKFVFPLHVNSKVSVSHREVYTYLSSHVFVFVLCYTFFVPDCCLRKYPFRDSMRYHTFIFYAKE